MLLQRNLRFKYYVEGNVIIDEALLHILENNGHVKL